VSKLFHNGGRRGRFCMSALTLAALLSIALASHPVIAADVAAAIKNDVQFRAMADELARTKALQLNNLDKPYFVEYTISDSDSLFIAASLGGIVSSVRSHSRTPRVQVRVGNYQFDNTNSIFSGQHRFGSLPLDDDYQALRTDLWLVSDSLYKNSTDQITRKRNALREIADPDKTPDLSPAKPLVELEAPAKLKVDKRQWEEILRRVSGRFSQAPSVMQSGVQFRAISSTYRLLNSEGTVVRIPQELADVRIRGEALAPDGSKVWCYRATTVLRAASLPDPDQLMKMADSVTADLESLAKAPVADDYSGPVLFVQEAAAQMLASSLTDAVRLQRKPVAPTGANTGQILESVWSSKMGSKVLPEWMSLIDDPSKEEFHGTVLAGAYKVDDEGVAAQRVLLVENGILKNYLASREPVKTVALSNGHGRLPGSFGSEEAVPGNLFVEARSTVKESEMKAKLLERVKGAGLKFGLLIRRLDFPSTADGEELQSMGRQLQKGGYSRTLNSPLLAYRVYPDGREELVRGLRFKDFSAKDLRDISLASDQPYVFNYVNNGSSFNYSEGSQNSTTTSVVSPSLLMDSVDLSRAENEPGKLPIVPAPALIAQQ
jgi:TldD protein